MKIKIHKTNSTLSQTHPHFLPQQHKIKKTVVTQNLMFKHTVTRGTGAWRQGKLTTIYINIVLSLCPILEE